MGFTIFESSGTFNPLNYGLNVGDLLHLVVIGGGGGGAGTANNYIAGKAGSSSSFGSILSAAGGLAPTDNNPVTPTANSFQGATGLMGKYTNFYTEQAGFGGNGADGWMPGLFKGRHGNNTNLEAMYNMQGSLPTSANGDKIAGGCQTSLRDGKIVNLAYIDSLISATKASQKMAGSGGIYVSAMKITTYRAYFGISGAGGFGYGAGGGGGCCVYDENTNSAIVKAGAGGNSGEIVQMDYILTTTNAVPVTVGTGGAGGSGYGGGSGANGCVAIFW